MHAVFARACGATPPGGSREGEPVRSARHPRITGECLGASLLAQHVRCRGWQKLATVSVLVRL
jgi:hypothetical protein